MPYALVRLAKSSVFVSVYGSCHLESTINEFGAVYGVLSNFTPNRFKENLFHALVDFSRSRVSLNRLIFRGFEFPRVFRQANELSNLGAETTCFKRHAFLVDSVGIAVWVVNWSGLLVMMTNERRDM